MFDKRKKYVNKKAMSKTNINRAKRTVNACAGQGLNGEQYRQHLDYCLEHGEEAYLQAVRVRRYQNRTRGRYQNMFLACLVAGCMLGGAVMTQCSGTNKAAIEQIDTD